MEELWKVVEGASRYEVSNTGKVWDTKFDREVSQVKTGVPQYLYVNMVQEDGQRKLVRVHRLVALAFIPTVDGCKVVDHIDRDKFNNRVDNLRWVDNSGNQRNTDNNVYVGGVLLKDYVLKYENPTTAYGYIWRKQDEGAGCEEAVALYDEYLLRGGDRQKVIWNNEEVYLSDLCQLKGKDKDVASRRISAGWDVWNALFDVNPNNNRWSFEVHSSIVSGVWFPTKEYLVRCSSVGEDRITELLESDSTWEEISSATPIRSQASNGSRCDRNHQGVVQTLRCF